MLERILVPLDGSLLAERILPELRRLLRGKDPEIVLVRAAVPPPVETSMMLLDGLQKAAREYLEAVRKRLAKDGLHVRAVVRPGSPVDVILDVAEEEKSTLLALATHGETGLKRLLAGSTAEALLRRSPIPAFVVRPFGSADEGPVESRPIRGILLPVEEVERSLSLLSPVTELAREFGSRVFILKVGPPEKKDVRSGVLGVRLRTAGIDVLDLGGLGEPVDEILETARHYPVDLIAMATHGRNGISRLVEGSVTESVLRKAMCPLLVVRA